MKVLTNYPNSEEEVLQIIMDNSVKTGIRLVINSADGSVSYRDDEDVEVAECHKSSLSDEWVGSYGAPWVFIGNRLTAILSCYALVSAMRRKK